MIVKPPTAEELEHIALQFGLNLTADDIASFQGLMAGPLASYQRLQALVEPRLPVKYPRTPGYKPERS